jgi:hypothetical protein
MTDKDLKQITPALYKLTYLLRTSLFPAVDLATQKKRVVLNYDPYYEIAGLPVIVIENILLSRNMFFRQEGFESPVKNMEDDPPTFTQRKNPLFLDIKFNLVAITDKVYETMPLYESLLAFVEANKYITVGGEDVNNEVISDDPDTPDIDESPEAYEYEMDFVNSIGRSFFQKTVSHLNQMTLQGCIYGVRVYPGIELTGTLVKTRVFKLFTVDGLLQLEEKTI